MKNRSTLLLVEELSSQFSGLYSCNIERETISGIAGEEICHCCFHCSASVRMQCLVCTCFLWMMPSCSSGTSEPGAPQDRSHRNYPGPETHRLLTKMDLSPLLRTSVFINNI